MFSSSSTPPAERPSGGAGGKRTSIAPWVLVGIWCLLMLFGLVAIVNPPWLRSLAESGASAEAISYSDRGDQRVREGDFRGGLWWYEKALKTDPTRVATRVNAAIAYGKLGRHEEGIRLLREVLTTESKQRGVILYNLGELYRRKGEIREAIGYYEQALEAGGRAALIYARLGESYGEIGNLSAACDAYRLGLAAWEDPATHYRNMLVAAVGTIEEHESHAPAEEVLARGITAADLERYDLETLRAQLERDPERTRLLARLKELEAEAP
jgi:tetratricopeptide (TPR) repeat protein